MIFAFVQFEFTHNLGPDIGRYVLATPEERQETAAERARAIRGLPEEDEPPMSAEGAAAAAEQPVPVALADEDPGLWEPAADQVTGIRRDAASADVLVMSLLGAPAARGSRILRRARRVDAGPPREVPILLATIVKASIPLQDGRQAADLLARCRASEEEQTAWIEDGLVQLNRAIRGHRAAARDPYTIEVARQDARAVRIGYGTGEDVARGGWIDAFEPIPEPVGKLDRSARLRPSEALAAILAERLPLLEAEELLLRASLDLEHDRGRAAALGLRAAHELLASELRDEQLPSGDGEDDGWARLRRGAEGSRELAAAAVRGPLDERALDRLEELLLDAGDLLDQWRSSVLG